MSMTKRKCLSVVAWVASFGFCFMLLLSAYAAAAHKEARAQGTDATEGPTTVIVRAVEVQAQP